MAAIDGETLELEVKHKLNGSWHPCRVSLSKAESAIIVNIENSIEEDKILTREDALGRLRFRSTPLENGDCSNINEGDPVLAMYKDQFKSFFFDAIIEKPNRVKHSNRVFCRCTFDIKWLKPEVKDEPVTIPSKSIMKLSKEEIDCHPIFTSFINALGPTKEVQIPSSPSFLEESNFEVDINEMLEKHIEEITRNANIAVECSSDPLLEVNRANFPGQKQSNSAASCLRSSSGCSSDFRRSTRSQKKEQVKVEELKKELKEDKPLLSPLAARAALASLFHGNELPKRELFFSHAESEGNVSVAKKELENYCPIQDTNVIMKNSQQSVTKKKTKSEESPCKEKRSVQALEEPEGDKGSAFTVARNSVDFAEAGKLSGQSMGTRVTRSSVHKKLEASPNEFSGQSITTRAARSSVHKVREASFNEVMQSSHSVELADSGKTTRATRLRSQKEHGYSSTLDPFKKTGLTQSTHDEISEESRNKKGESCIIVSNSADSERPRVTRSSAHKGIEPSLNEIGQGFSNKKFSNLAKVTRSTRSSAQKEPSIMNVDTSLCQSSTILDTHEKSEDFIPLESKTKKRSISSVGDPVTKLHQDGTKRLTRSSAQKVPSISNVDTSLCQLSMIIDTREKSEEFTPLERKSKKRSISSVGDPVTKLHQDGTKRLTRSSAQKEHSFSNVDTNLSQSSRIEDADEKFNEDVVPSQSKIKKRLISSTGNSINELHHDGEAVTSEASVAFLKDSTENASGELKKSGRKKAVPQQTSQPRSSPRLILRKTKS